MLSNRSRLVCAALIFAAACFCSGGEVFAADAAKPPAPHTWGALTIGAANFKLTDNDFLTLFKALVGESKHDSGAVIIVMKTPLSMPSYDPIAHYAGTGVDSRHPKAPVVWELPSSLESHTRTLAVERALMLAAMDSGKAGPRWKHIYDVAALADASLPATTPDPYLHWHELTKQIQSIAGGSR